MINTVHSRSDPFNNVFNVCLFLKGRSPNENSSANGDVQFALYHTGISTPGVLCLKG